MTYKQRWFTADNTSGDKLERKAQLHASFPTLAAAWARIMELEDSLEQAQKELIRAQQPIKECRFPEHRDQLGNVTHIQDLGAISDDPMSPSLMACEVCGSVRMEYPVAIAGALPKIAGYAHAFPAEDNDNV